MLVVVAAAVAAAAPPFPFRLLYSSRRKFPWVPPLSNLETKEKEEKWNQVQNILHCMPEINSQCNFLAMKKQGQVNHIKGNIVSEKARKYPQPSEKVLRFSNNDARHSCPRLQLLAFSLDSIMSLFT